MLWTPRFVNDLVYFYVRIQDVFVADRLAAPHTKEQ